MFSQGNDKNIKLLYSKVITSYPTNTWTGEKKVLSDENTSAGRDTSKGLKQVPEMHSNAYSLLHSALLKPYFEACVPFVP